MVNNTALTSVNSSTFNGLNRYGQLISIFMGSRQAKTHDYTNCKIGLDYAIDVIDDAQIQMTAQRRNVKVGDYILLKNDLLSASYKVTAIEYYSSPTDMWTAQLKVVMRE